MNKIHEIGTHKHLFITVVRGKLGSLLQIKAQNNVTRTQEQD